MVLTEVTEVAEEMAATAVRMELVVKVQAMARLVVGAVIQLRSERTVTEVGAEMLAIVARLVEPAEPQAWGLALRDFLVSTEIRHSASHRQ
jgi:hypothetical protein